MPGMSMMEFHPVTGIVATGEIVFASSSLSSDFVYSENLLALQAPSTTKCDFCQVLFCGIGVQERCIAMPVSSQHPHNLSTHADLIQSCDIYDCFGGNIVEVEIMLEYVETRKLPPRHVYRDVGLTFPLLCAFIHPL